MMMRPTSNGAQVRNKNSSDEIPDGISSRSIVLYGTRCQDDAERSGYDLKPPTWAGMTGQSGVSRGVLVERLALILWPPGEVFPHARRPHRP
jgi:hypothetical protein